MKRSRTSVEWNGEEDDKTRRKRKRFTGRASRRRVSMMELRINLATSCVLLAPEEGEALEIPLPSFPRGKKRLYQWPSKDTNLLDPMVGDRRPRHSGRENFEIHHALSSYVTFEPWRRSIVVIPTRSGGQNLKRISRNLWSRIGRGERPSSFNR